MVVHSRDGLDEISIGDRTEVAELKGGQVRRFSIQPEDFGLKRTPINQLKAADAAASLTIIRGVLDNQPGPARDIVQLNAGAAIYTAGIANTLQEGFQKAGEAIESGEARNRLDRLVILTQSFD
jgi:anthranilate phosphoribosyltransferase